MDNDACKVLIPACGKSARYKDKTNLPKGVVDFVWNDRKGMMIDHIMHGLPRHWRATVICSNEDFRYFARLSNRFDLNSLKGGSAGQADTVFQALRNGYGRIAPHEDFLVVNCDNVITNLIGAVRHFRSVHARCGAVVFKEESGRSNYGFVNGAPTFNEGAEKRRLSDYALAGAFYFNNRATFDSAYQRQIIESREPREMYISGMFKHIIGGCDAFVIVREALHEWGTAVDLENDQTVSVDWSKQHE
jgi:hypothetical protein